MTPRTGPGSRRPTIIDVAARAGVSRQTVTRAVNDMPGISAPTRARVLEAAAELGYRPSRFGRGLVQQGPTTLGILVEDLGSGFFADLGSALVRSASRRGWTAHVAETVHAPDPREVPRQLGRTVDALVGYGELGGPVVGGIGLPVVRMDGQPADAVDCGVVVLDAEQAMADLAAHLHRSGARAIAVVDRAPQTPSRRGQALLRALEEHRARTADPAPDSGDGLDGGDERRAVLISVDPVEGHERFLQALRADGIDTVIAFHDDLAVRLLRALRRSGLRAPEDMRVVGVDGLEIGRLVAPELTTLAVDREAIAEETTALVAGMLEGTVPLGGEQAVRVIPFRLVVRDSA